MGMWGREIPGIEKSMAKNTLREYQSPDGIRWNVVVQSPTHSSAMLLFKHPDGETSRLDRYAWVNSSTVTDPRERLTAKSVMDALTDADIARLFRRSMMVSANRDFVSRSA
jgi:hypothetical protein